MTIAAKLLIAAEACGYVQKDGNNAFHKYRYASAANILGHVNDALTKAGLAVVETLPEIVSEAGTGKDRVVTARMTLTVGDTETAERATFRGLGSGMDSGDKAVMKAITAATKYAWMGAFSISTGDDPEADENTDRRAAKKPDAPPPPAPRPAPQGDRPITAASVARLGIEQPQRAPREITHAIDPRSGAVVQGDDTERLTPAEEPARDSFAEAVDAIELPGEAVAVWMKHRDAIVAMSADDQKSARQYLAARVAHVGQMTSKAAALWIAKAIKEEDARRAAEVSA